MAALTATDWTIDVQDRSIEGQKKRNRVQLTLATAGTYPSNGIPLPDDGDLGMTYNLDYVLLSDENSSSVNPIKYDQSNNTIRVYSATTTDGAHITELATTVTAGAGGNFVIFMEAVGF